MWQIINKTLWKWNCLIESENGEDCVRSDARQESNSHDMESKA